MPTDPLSRLPPLPMGSGVQVMGEWLLQLLLTTPPCAPQLYQLHFHPVSADDALALAVRLCLFVCVVVGVSRGAIEGRIVCRLSYWE